MCSNVGDCRIAVDNIMRQRLSLTNRLKEQRTRLRKETESERAGKEALVFLQVLVAQVQQGVHNQIATLVSRCLSAVFDDPYEFRIYFEMKRGRTEARLVFERDGLEVDPLTASGGGVVDVASFALRLACLTLSNLPLRRALIFDEPFKFVSPEFRGNLRNLIKSLSEELGVQFIIVTHMDILKLGKVIELI